jgi:hypothetical protein
MFAPLHRRSLGIPHVGLKSFHDPFFEEVPVRASRIRFVAAAVVVLGAQGCVSAEGHNSDYGSDSPSYLMSPTGGIPAIRANVLPSRANLRSSRSVASSSDSWEWGVGVRAAPAFETGSPGVTVHPMASYTYLNFDGGHDDRFEFGGQLRKALGQSASSRGFWLGAEAAFAVLREHIDKVDGTDNTNGFSATALAGVPVADAPKWNPSLYAGVGYSHYGSSGINVRVGLDLQPWFLKR